MPGYGLTEAVRAIGLGLIAGDFTEGRIEVARGATRLVRTISIRQFHSLLATACTESSWPTPDIHGVQIKGKRLSGVTVDHD